MSEVFLQACPVPEPNYCYLPIPFRKAVRITLLNRSYESGGEFFYEVGYSQQLPREQKGATIGYFGAKYNKAWPITEPKDYVLFDYKGVGAVIGQVMTVEPIKPDRKRWWEGDMRIYIDAEEKPRFHGTGHEDEYQGAGQRSGSPIPIPCPCSANPRQKA